MASFEEREGPVRSIERAARIIKVLGGNPLEGARLSDLASMTGLGKSTAHRIVSALVEEGFLYQNTENRRYYLGYELIKLAHASSVLEIAEAARPSLDRLALETEDVAFVQSREGRESICLDRRVGSFPIKTLTLNVGDRRPLGVGAGSLALLAWLSAPQMEEYFAGYTPPPRYAGFTAQMLRELVARSKREGYALNEGRIIAGMAAVGVPVLDGQGHALAALSVAAIQERMSEERRRWIVSLLTEEAAAFARRLQARHGAGREVG
jgi:DNA-binding IclR family transcriptional regulator